VRALESKRWGVVVVDGARHRRARTALDKFEHTAETVLLTATPFQLDMTGLHGLTRHLVEGKAAAHKVLNRGAERVFGPPVARIDGRVVQEAEERGPFAVEMRHQAPDRWNPTALVEDRRQARLQVTARHGEPVNRNGARRVPVTELQGLLQDGLNVGRHQSARMIGL